MIKKLFVCLSMMLLFSCSPILKKLDYNDYNRNLNSHIIDFNVYDLNDSLINTNIYKNKVNVLTFIRVNKVDLNYCNHLNQTIKRFSNFKNVSFINIAVESDVETWKQFQLKYALLGINLLCKDDQNKIYNFYDDKTYALSIIYDDKGLIKGYNLMDDGLMVGPFYVINHKTVVEGLKSIDDNKNWDKYTNYVVNEINNAMQDSSYVMNPNYYEIDFLKKKK